MSSHRATQGKQQQASGNSAGDGQDVQDEQDDDMEMNESGHSITPDTSDTMVQVNSWPHIFNLQSLLVDGGGIIIMYIFDSFCFPIDNVFSN